MQRTRTNPTEKPSLILCSDFHLREDTPVCWTGDFQKEQWESVNFVKKLQKQYDCPVFHAGDLFDHWKPSPWLLSMAMTFLPDNFYSIYGQHDLPQHNWELRDKSGLHALSIAGRIKVLNGFHYGMTPDNTGILVEYERIICVWHHMTYILPPFPGATGGQADRLLAKYSGYDLIITGDNHQSFWTNYGKQLLVNPGSLTRQDADQINFKPRVALWYARTNTIQWVNIPIHYGVITREHIEVKERRDARIEAFVSRLDGEWEVGVSFEQNLKEFLNVNNIREPVKEIVYKMTA